MAKPNSERARVNVDLGWPLRRVLLELRRLVRKRDGLVMPLSDSEVIRYALVRLACDVLPVTELEKLAAQRLRAPMAHHRIREELKAREKGDRKQ